MQFSVENVREVARVLVEANLGEVTLERLASENVPAARLSVKRSPVMPLGVETFAESIEVESTPEPATEAVQAVIVTSTCVGIFRAAKKPVEVGARVTKRQIVGVVESLRIPNEIYAPEVGVVSQVFVSDGQGVEWGQILMEIVPEAV